MVCLLPWKETMLYLSHCVGLLLHSCPCLLHLKKYISLFNNRQNNTILHVCKGRGCMGVAWVYECVCVLVCGCGCVGKSLQTQFQLEPKSGYLTCGECNYLFDWCTIMNQNHHPIHVIFFITSFKMNIYSIFLWLAIVILFSFFLLFDLVQLELWLVFPGMLLRHGLQNILREIK